MRDEPGQWRASIRFRFAHERQKASPSGSRVSIPMNAGVSAFVPTTLVVDGAEASLASLIDPDFPVIVMSGRVRAVYPALGGDRYTWTATP